MEYMLTVLDSYGIIKRERYIMKSLPIERCDICLEEICKGKHDCKCRSCNQLKECYRILHPTIRLTTKCTQECGHCCFCCSPRETKMMNLDTAKAIVKFIENNGISSINLMGGEFFLNPDWFEIIRMFADVVYNARLVTTGDWISNQDVCEKLLNLKAIVGETLWIAISNDKWHNNRNVEEAEEFLRENGFAYIIGNEDTGSDESIVPIGRSEGTFNFYGSLACYCHNPKNKYSFLINEKGKIYKCAFGVWDYANVYEFQNGGFAKVFKEYNRKFYGVFIPSCSSCIRSARRGKHLDAQYEE